MTSPGSFYVPVLRCCGVTVLGRSLFDRNAATPKDKLHQVPPVYNDPAMRQTTRADHEIRLEEVVRYIAEHLDEPINLGDLADLACLSRFHFHRVFQALLGETVGEMSRRLRLERASESLRTTDEPITELAFETGYSTHEALIRAFRTAFGCTPR
jgi:AraC family transcriptional regulator